MKRIIARLKLGINGHPGVGLGVMMVVLGAMAGFQDPHGGWQSALFGMLIMGAVAWIPIISTAYEIGKRREQNQ